MVLTVSCALFPVNRTLFVTVIGAMRKHRRQLGTSLGVPEPHAFSVRGRLSQKLLGRPGTGRAEAWAKAVQRHSSFDTAASIASRAQRS